MHPPAFPPRGSGSRQTHSQEHLEPRDLFLHPLLRGMEPGLEEGQLPGLGQGTRAESRKQDA